MQHSIKNIAVLIKQVPNTNQITIDPVTGTLKREGLPSIMNPDDKHGLEAALQLKELTGAQITVVTMGPAQAKAVLTEAYCMGADRLIHLSDRLFAGADTLATSYTLAAALKQVGASFGGFDVIFTGREAIDGDTAQVGPQIAEQLDIPQVTYVRKLEVLGDGNKGARLRVERALEEGCFIIEVETPVLLTAIKDLNIPRYPHAMRVFDAHCSDSGFVIESWGAKDLPELDETRLGLKGSPTKVAKSFTPTIKRSGELLSQVAELKTKLRERHLI